MNNQTALAINGAGNFTIENCVFERDNRKSNDELANEGQSIRGIEISAAADGSIGIRNNLFTGSAVNVYRNSSWQSAIYLNGGAQLVNIEDNVFEVNRTALNLDDFSDAITVEGNTFGPGNGTHISFGGTTRTEGSYSMSGNEFAVQGTVFNLSNVTPDFRLDATENTFGGKSPDQMSLEELFALESSIYHKGKGGRNGFVRVLAGHVFVTPQSGSIQDAIDVAEPGDTIVVAPGLYQIDSQVQLPSELTIVGSEDGATIIDATELSGNNYVFTLSNNAKVRLENLTFIGTNTQIFVRAASTTHVDSLEVISCVFQGGSYPIYLAERSSNPTDVDNMIGSLVIEGCEFESALHVYLGRAVTASAAVRNNVFRGAKQIGLEFYTWEPNKSQTATIEIVDNTFFDIEYPIVLLSRGAVTVSDTEVSYEADELIVIYLKEPSGLSEFALGETVVNGNPVELACKELSWGCVHIYYWAKP